MVTVVIPCGHFSERTASPLSTFAINVVKLYLVVTLNVVFLSKGPLFSACIPAFKQFSNYSITPHTLNGSPKMFMFFLQKSFENQACPPLLNGSAAAFHWNKAGGGGVHRREP